MSRDQFRYDLSAIFVGSFGYFAYYEKTGGLYWLWIGILIIGIISLAIGNFYYYLHTKSAIVLLDIPVLIMVFILLKNIDLYYGMFLLLAFVLCFGYGFVTKKHRKKFFKN